MFCILLGGVCRHGDLVLAQHACVLDVAGLDRGDVPLVVGGVLVSGERLFEEYERCGGAGRFASRELVCLGLLFSCDILNVVSCKPKLALFPCLGLINDPKDVKYLYCFSPS